MNKLTVRNIFLIYDTDLKVLNVKKYCKFIIYHKK
jgi:hypothetical protein